MALTTTASGSQLCDRVTPLEHTLATTTTAGTYVTTLNLTTSVNGDSFRIRVYTKTLTGDTAECVCDVMYANDQGNLPIVHLPPYVSMFSYAVTLQQTAGTARTIPWSVVQIAA